MFESLNMSLIFGTGLEGLGGNPLTPPEKARKKRSNPAEKNQKIRCPPPKFLLFFFEGYVAYNGRESKHSKHVIFFLYFCICLGI